MKKKYAAWLVAGTLFGATALAAFAHGDATGIVAERMDGMMMLGAQMKQLNAHFSGTEVLDADELSMLGLMIEQHSGEEMLSLFPEGSIEGPSEARPEIWVDWTSFSTLAAQLERLGAEFSLAVSEPPPEPALAAAGNDKPSLSAWDKLNVDVLLGVKAKVDSQAELANEAANSSTPATPQTRKIKSIFAEIAATCSSCHSNFRR